MSYIAFPYLADATYVKPNKFDKLAYPSMNEKFYLDFAKWALFNAAETKHTEWIHNIYRNKEFYKGDQWSQREDIESFLMDDSGQTRNRIKIVLNQIRPMVEQYRGNAIRLALGASAKAISKNARVRREEALKKVLFSAEVANEFPDLGEIIKAQNPELQGSPEEIEMIFNNTYVDKYVQNINRLIEFSSMYNDMDEMKVKIAESMAFAGLGAIEEFKHGEHLRKEVVEPEEFFWDRNARRNDLQDSAYMGRVHMMTLPDIYERYQGLTQEDKEALELYVSTESNINNTYTANHSNTNTGNSIPVYKIFFKDWENMYYGYVEDEFGQPYFVPINQPDELSDGKVWKESDLIEPPQTPENKRLFKKGEKKRRVTVCVIRYTIFIPGEVLNYRVKDRKDVTDPLHDIILEYGPYDYQETQWMDLSHNNYPIKAYCWAYVNGEVMSPIDDIINPQRFMNRIMSSLEGQINMSGGSSIVYDKDMLESSDDELEILANANAGKPIGIRTRGKGVPNTVGAYDNTVKGGTYQMFQLLPIIKQLMQDITGINEGLRGESTGSDQLVGVTQMLIQRGSLMQEPFYNAIAKVFVQSHQATATFGKDIYVRNQRELNIIVGDEGVEVFKLSQGMANEEFRVFITRDASPEQVRQQADGLLYGLRDSQIIDDKMFADMIGRSTLDQIYSRLREEVNKRLIAQQKAEQEAAAANAIAAEEQQEAAIQGVEQARLQELDNMQIAAAEKERDHQHDLEKEAMKAAIQGAGQQGQQGQLG